MILSCLAVSCNTVLGQASSGEDILFPPAGPRSQFSRAYEHLTEGQPDHTAMRVRGGFYVWKTGESWHVRLSRSEGPSLSYSRGSVFSGRISVENGFLEHVDTRGITQRPFSDFRHSDRDIFFSVEPRERLEGFDFEVRPAGAKYCLSIDLQLNRGSAPSLVYLGRSMSSPETLPFYVCYPY